MNYYTLFAVFFVVGLFTAMLLLLEVGRQIGARQMLADPEGAKPGLGPVVGVVFSLLGLLLAFTFSGAAARFETRKQLVVQEVNTLGKAYHLLDLEYPRVGLIRLNATDQLLAELRKKMG